MPSGVPVNEDAANSRSVTPLPDTHVTNAAVARNPSAASSHRPPAKRSRPTSTTTDATVDQRRTAYHNYPLSRPVAYTNVHPAMLTAQQAHYYAMQQRINPGHAFRPSHPSNHVAAPRHPHQPTASVPLPPPAMATAPIPPPNATGIAANNSRVPVLAGRALAWRR